MSSGESPRLHPPDGFGRGEIALRLPRRSDLSAIVAACQDPEISTWTTVPAQYGEAEGRDFLQQCEEARREGTGVVFAIVDAEGDEFLGTIGARLLDQSTAEMGYWVKGEARGRGVASGSLRLLSEWCFYEAGFERLQLLAEPGNLPSQRVAERVGYWREGLLRSEFVNKGVRRDVFVYSLLPSDLDVGDP